MADWWSEAIIDRGNDSGTYTDLGEPKGLLHTTEGKTYAGARQAYVLNNSWPHATVTFQAGIFRCYQHVPLSKPARALRNESGGVQTNRDNVIQLEIVGTADRHNASTWGDQYVENFPQEYLDGIARWMRFVETNHRVPRRCTVKFIRYPESYGANGVRLTGPQWDAYTGWLGHQHAPENTHGDPGLIDMVYLLAGITQEAPLQLDADDQKFIRDQVQRLGDKLMLGGGNSLFPSSVYGDATTLPRIMTAVLASAGSDVDEAAVAAEVLKVLTPEAIAAAIPDDIAEQVADELAQRLTS